MNGTTSKNIAPYIVAVIASVFLIVIAYMMFFVPKMDESKKLVANAATAHAGNVALTAKADRLEAIAKNLDPLKTQVNEFSESFPSSARQQEMIDAINEAATSTGVTLTALSPNIPKPVEGEEKAADATADATSQATQEGTSLPGPAPVGGTADQAVAAPTAQLGTVSLKVDGKGTLEAVKAFVIKIEGLKRPLLVHEMLIEKQESGYHLSLSGETYLAAPLVEPRASTDTSEQAPENVSLESE